MLRVGLSSLSKRRSSCSLVEAFAKLGLGGGNAGAGVGTGGLGVTAVTTSPFWQQTRTTVRSYYVMDGNPLWYRRRRKAREQRLRVLNPSSPIIDHTYPLPPTNEGRYAPDLFGQEEEKDVAKEEEEAKGIVAEINRQAQMNDHGRLFAVINLKGKQFKVTPEDILVIQGHWAPNIGDRLRFHKILLLGSADFTLMGRPLLDAGLVRVEGTVVEKTVSYTKLHFVLKKRKNFRRLKFFKDPYTIVRVNMIEMLKPLEIPAQIHEDEPLTVEGDFSITNHKKEAHVG